MSNDKPSFDNIIRFPVEAVSKFGLKRADKRPDGRSARMESEGQLTLFNGSAPAPPERLGKVVPLPRQMSPFEEALVLDDQGDDRAAELYIKAIEEDDYVADAWCNLGVLKSREDDLDMAFDCFAQSLANDPRHAESHYNIGNLYFEIGDLRVARTHYEIAADIDPEFPSVHFNLGLVTALSEDYESAHNALVRFKTLAPESEWTVADELLGYIRTAIHLTS